MNLGRRRAHRVVWVLLAAALPLLFVLALRARHAPSERTLPAPLVGEGER